LYDGETLILAEVKQGNNIEPRDIEQAEKLDSVTIDAAEEFMDNVDVDRFGLSGDVYSVESLIYYDGIDKRYIDGCQDEWENCRERLVELQQHCPVLGRVEDRRLRLLTGSFDSQELTEWLKYGIKMSKTPRVTVSMTDGLEIESVAVTICNIWGQRAVSDPIKVDVSQLRTHFNYRSLEPGRVQNAFKLIEELGAGDHINKRELVFRPEHMADILNIESLVSQRSGDGSREGGLDEFFD